MADSYINIHGEHRRAKDLDVPKDRTFRAAWQLDGDVVEVDMNKAKELHRERLREARKEHLAVLDAAWFRAAEEGDEAEQKKIAAKKKALRDVTKSRKITSAKTPEELKALTLESLVDL
jgi:hypothetical protein